MYAAQMILAIGHLHAKGIAHRDLKLENILVDHEGYIKVIDYGLAKKIPRGQKSHEFLGTFLYMAPEMVAKSGHGQAIDWWALGIILFEALFGFTPFLAATKEQRFEKIQHEKLKFPSRNNWTVPQHNLCNLIDKLLEKDASKRLGSGPNDYLEILEHPVFKDLDIEKLKKK
jgi:serine/threonine protein kinase